jgi:hypothetical protein
LFHQKGRTPVGRARRVMPFLQRREATWYFRFKLPRRLPSFAGRSEIRVSLGTTELWVARQQAERVLPDVYSIKVLARHMSALEPGRVRNALDLAFGNDWSRMHQGRGGSIRSCRVCRRLLHCGPCQRGHECPVYAHEIDWVDGHGRGASLTGYRCLLRRITSRTSSRRYLRNHLDQRFFAAAQHRILRKLAR